MNEESFKKFIEFYKENLEKIQEIFLGVYETKKDLIKEDEDWCENFSNNEGDPNKENLKEIFSEWIDAYISEAKQIEEELIQIEEKFQEEDFWGIIPHLAELGYLKMDSRSCILNSLINQGIGILIGEEINKSIPKNVDDFLNNIFEKKDPGIHDE